MIIWTIPLLLEPLVSVESTWLLWETPIPKPDPIWRSGGWMIDTTRDSAQQNWSLKLVGQIDWSLENGQWCDTKDSESVVESTHRSIHLQIKR